MKLLFIKGIESLFEGFGFIERLFESLSLKHLVLKAYSIERFWF